MFRLPWLVALLPLTVVAAPFEVKSTAEMQLKVAGEFALAGPKKPLSYRLDGPGRVVITIAPAEVTGVEHLTVNVEITSAGAVLRKEKLTVDWFPRLGAVESSVPFVPFGFKRFTLQLPPKKQGLYQVRVSTDAAISVTRPTPSKLGYAQEIPAKPEEKVPTFVLAAKERWYWGSVCDGVRVSVAEAGILHVQARMQLQSVHELPPPSFLRVLVEGKVKAAAPITGAPETGLEFASGKMRYPSGTKKKLEIPVEGKSELQVELAAWGCVNGVGFEFQFEPGARGAAVATTEPSSEIPARAPNGTRGGLASEVGEKAPAATSEALTQCNLLMEDVTRQRVLEYLDTMVASGIIPAARVAVKQDLQLGDSFFIESVAYVVDDVELIKRDNPQRGTSLAGDKPVVPGPHIFDVRLVVRGQGAGQYAHLNDFVFRIGKKESFVAEAGKRYEARVAFKDRGGFGTALRDRPYVELEIRPVEP
jgi:hypothetical protein